MFSSLSSREILGNLIAKEACGLPVREITIFGAWSQVGTTLKERSEYGTPNVVNQSGTTPEGYPWFDMTDVFAGMPTYAWIVKGTIHALTTM